MAVRPFIKKAARRAAEAARERARGVKLTAEEKAYMAAHAVSPYRDEG